MWTPDVYEGAPTPITALFRHGAKVAAMACSCAPCWRRFPGASHQWRQIIIFISVLSMALGAVAAIGQNNIKRLMAYSSIGHMGYALLGLAAGTALGVRGVLIYLAIYVVTNLGVFACIQAMRRGGKPVETSPISRAWRARSPACLCLRGAVAQSCGPAAAGRLFANSMSSWPRSRRGSIWPAILGVLASVVGAYYYLRLVKVMYFDEPAQAFRRDMRPEPRRCHRGASTASSRPVRRLIAAPLIDSASAAAKALVP